MRTLFHDARLVAAMDDARSRLPGGWVLVDDDRIEAVGAPPVPAAIQADRRVDAAGKVILPGLVNTHHHLPQVLTRCVPRVQEAPLFRWLTDLYEAWRATDEEAVEAAALRRPRASCCSRERRPPPTTCTSSPPATSG